MLLPEQSTSDDDKQRDLKSEVLSSNSFNNNDDNLVTGPPSDDIDILSDSDSSAIVKEKTEVPVRVKKKGSKLAMIGLGGGVLLLGIFGIAFFFQNQINSSDQPMLLPIQVDPSLSLPVVPQELLPEPSLPLEASQNTGATEPVFEAPADQTASNQVVSAEPVTSLVATPLVAAPSVATVVQPKAEVRVAPRPRPVAQPTQRPRREAVTPAGAAAVPVHPANEGLRNSQEYYGYVKLF